MAEIFKTLRLFISLAIPHIIKFIQRNKNIWVYGGRNGKFVDNTKYWFIWANENLPSIKHIWITNNQDTLNLLKYNNYKVFKPFSLQGMYFILRSKIFFYTHGASSIIRPIFLEGGIKFDFFHGIPMKTMRIEKTKKFNHVSGPNFKYSISKKLFNYYQKKYYDNDYLIIPSYIYADQFSSYSGKRIFEGYPRNIVFSWSQEKLLQLINFSVADVGFLASINSFSRRYIYMPTFREGAPDFIVDAFKNLEELNGIMVQQDAVFLLKLHPYTKTKVDFTNYSNIHVVDNEMDIYPFLPMMDCLITDYSSISMDFYFSDHVVIFYLFDLNEFIGTSRDIDFHPDELAKQSSALTWAEFINLIVNFDEVPTLKNQSGRGHFDSQIKPDLPKLAKLITDEIL